MSIGGMTGDVLVVRGGEAVAALEGQEGRVMELVGRAYEAHLRGHTVLPQSSFLRFPGPGQERNRIIALPAYLGEEFGMGGIKWISSFPGNLDRGIERASAVLILNAVDTGRPLAFLESSAISAARTAGSAALAAGVLHGDRELTRCGLVGCGAINYEITRYLRGVFPRLDTLVLHDADPERAAQFGERCRRTWPGLSAVVRPRAEDVLAETRLVSFATTAATPYVSDVSMCGPGTTLLHVSLRDLAPEVILAADNVVDDVDHVCRAQTSVHLAEAQAGNRGFIRCTLAEITCGDAEPRPDPGRVTVFSPFGLGILDLAVGSLVYTRVRDAGGGLEVESFFPRPWLDRD